jgi:hypothetical protein
LDREVLPTILCILNGGDRIWNHFSWLGISWFEICQFSGQFGPSLIVVALAVGLSWVFVILFLT